MNKKEKNIVQLLENLLSSALKFWASEECKLLVHENIEYFEYGLAFEEIIYELHENKIFINNEFYLNSKKIADLMGLNEDEYHPRLQELIKN